MKDLGRIIKTVIGTLMIFSFFFIVLEVINIHSEYVFPYTIFKALGWSALLYGIIMVVGFVYNLTDRILRKSEEEEEEEEEENVKVVIADLAFMIGGLILLLIGGVFLNICY